MKLQTKYFGEIDYEREDVLSFPAGLFGFEDEKEFLLLPFEGSGETMLCFQSVRTAALAFVSMNPFALAPDYEPVLQAHELAELGVAESAELAFYVLCVVKNPVADSTVNLKCPVVINPDTRVARQVILETDSYEMRHPLAAFGKKEASPC